jgi:hypothetical protein
MNQKVKLSPTQEVAPDGDPNHKPHHHQSDDNSNDTQEDKEILVKLFHFVYSLVM